MEEPDLIPHLFRKEFSKITTVLCKLFGIENMQAAEDIAADTFLSALETWTYRGVPENPEAWLYAVAKNKAKTRMRRNQVFREKVLRHCRMDMPEDLEAAIDLSFENIRDSQLRMLFAVCHPSVSPEGQVALALRILCGFGIDEIATAFLTSKETVNKRLFRAREKLRRENAGLEFPGEKEMVPRLEAVLTTLYLLFNEGYYSETNDNVLREDLCGESMRLAGLLLEHPPTDLPPVRALLALMCFHASRFAARKAGNGELILYEEQDTSKWDQELIGHGASLLSRSAQGETITPYHLEAAIAYWHTVREDSGEKWANILRVYDLLLNVKYTPVAAMNRVYALFRAEGRETAIAAAHALGLEDNPFYFALLGELYGKTERTKAAAYFHKAIALARSKADRQAIQKRIDNL